ncbi:Mss4-like protein [Trametes polyzona]|nr:Mss4-like protein [Trametes polyzona]
MLTDQRRGRSIDGSCFCGAVSYSATGPPLLSAFCHCTACQRLSGCPFVHTIHFPETSFQWTHPSPHEARLDSYVVSSKPWKTRFRCKNCGACVMSANSKAGKRSVWGAHLTRDDAGKIVDWETVKPTAHIFYGTRMLDIADSLGKWEGYEGNSARID